MFGFYDATSSSDGAVGYSAGDEGQYVCSKSGLANKLSLNEEITAATTMSRIYSVELFYGMKLYRSRIGILLIDI